jgi:hypothetical protein
MPLTFKLAALVAHAYNSPLAHCVHYLLHTAAASSGVACH